MNTIPQELLPHFIEISNRLWSGHAAIMVGAGFSKNAIRSSNSNKKFPSWIELGNTFYKKVHGHLSGNNNFLNVLRLASEVEAAFGRNVLERILKSEVPDKEYEPSILHKKLLQLPWKDVFTTNYDTLLERAAEKVFQYRYETILNKEDLVLSSQPRIIKLHGSFPSERPLIITEEDYRQYPRKFSPFVNTVQQSLLENTLCLIGFSGDDPNFLSWIGWIRDNLGRENSPKIYLIGSLTLSVGQKRLLEERNIIALDLSLFDNVSNNHSKALTLFVDFLHCQGRIKNFLNWPDQNKMFGNTFNEGEEETKIHEIIKNWREKRNSFPQWLIVPEDIRDTLQNYTPENILPFFEQTKKLKASLEFEFLYEYNWRIEKCLVPIENRYISHYEYIRNKYNPFKSLEVEFGNSIGLNECEVVDISHKWVEINLSMMRYYREEGIHEKWIITKDCIGKVLDYMDPELVARYYYERCLYFLFALKLSEVRNELSLWPSNPSLTYWEVRRAGILAELGDVIESEKILESSLNLLREKGNLTPVFSDYSFVSQESYVMFLLENVKRSVSILNKTYRIPDDITNEYVDRWDTLIKYKCDPWAEHKYFKNYLKKGNASFKRVRKKIGFDIGTVSTSHNLGINIDGQKAYSYLRFVEEIGYPYVLPKIAKSEILISSTIFISELSPYWAFSSFVRLGNPDEIHQIFGRRALAFMEIEKNEKLICNYISILENEIEKVSIPQDYAFANSLASTIPEILSRLCLKSGYDIRLKILQLLKSLYSSKQKYSFKRIVNLAKRLINSFTSLEQYNLLPVFIEFPILSPLSELHEDEFPDLFYFINLEFRTIDNKIDLKLDSRKIDELFEIAKNGGYKRKIVTLRLAKLYDYKLLNGIQTVQFGELLWNRTNKENGFPDETAFIFNFPFLKFPYPSNVNPNKLYKKYINSISLPIQSKQEGNGLQITNGNIPIFKELYGSMNIDVNYKWTKKELQIIVSKISEWWEKDKRYLKEKKDDHIFGSTQLEFSKRFKNLISVFCRIIAPQFNLLDESVKAEIKRVIDELESYNMQDLLIKSRFSVYFQDYDKGIESEILKNLYSKSKVNYIEALEAIKVLYELQSAKCAIYIHAVSECIKSLSISEISKYLAFLSFIINNSRDIVDRTILNNIELALSTLFDVTKFTDEDSEEDIHIKIACKKEIATLTVALLKYFKFNGLEIPKYIENWRIICSDPSEFSEIRRVWIEESPLN